MLDFDRKCMLISSELSSEQLTRADSLCDMEWSNVLYISILRGISIIFHYFHSDYKLIPNIKKQPNASNKITLFSRRDYFD